MLYKKNPLWLTMVLAAGTQAHADQRLDDVQVTANRLPQSQTDVLASTTVIDRAEIERLQADSVVELLQGRAGIELARTGGRGNQTSLFMRGTNSDHALVLVDGARIASATDGSINWEFLPVAAIERIEIVRGPRAAAYGADAIGGVINILTRRAEQQGQQATLTLRAGEQGSSQQSAWFSSVDNGTRLSALIDNESTDGFSARANGGDDDGFEQATGKLAFEHAFADKADLRVSLLRSSTDYDYDDCFDPQTFMTSQDCRGEGTQQVASAALTTHLRSDWDAEVSVAQTRESRERTVDGTASGETSTRRNEIALTNRFVTEHGGAVLGVDYRDESLDSPEAYSEDSRDNWGTFANWHGRFKRHHLSAGLRHDDDDAFGGFTTGSLAYAYALTSRQEIGASYGTAYKAPSLLELYGPFGANPDLEAEESRTAELFWRLRDEAWRLELTAFDTRVDKLISFTGPNFTPINVDEARIRGIEVSGGWEAGNLLLNAAVTHQKPENDETGERLQRRARTFGRIDADYRLADWNVGATLRSASYRHDIDADTFADSRVAGYGVVDLRTAWQVTPRIELSAKVENVLDRQYQLVDGYNTQDRYIEGGITLRL